MLRTVLLTTGLILSWALVVVATVLAEAAWLAEPDVRRDEISSIRNHLDSQLAAAARNRALGSATLVLIHNGELIFEKGYGVANAEDHTPVDTARTLFQVGSVSKTVTAFGVMRLVQEGKVGLDEPVIKRLKRWRFAGSDERRDRVTVRQLLSHTSGISDPLHDADKGLDERVQTLEEFLSGSDATTGVRVSSEPGSSFVYGNAATGILQLLIEDITSQEFSIYMRDNVLMPLGMTHSTFDLETAIGQLAPAFDASVNPQSPRRHPARAAVAFYTSGRDLGLFARALAGGNAVLSEATMRTMFVPTSSTGGSWGLGLTLFTENGAGSYVVGHDGGARPSWGAVVRMNPATRNGLVMTISGGRGAANQLEHDWVYWETGKVTFEARRQVVYGRALHAVIAILVGTVLIAIFRIIRYRNSEGF